MGQTLDENIEAHRVKVDQARQKVIDKFQELILQADEKGDSDRAGKMREYSQFFINKGVMFIPEGNTGIVPVFKEYGSSIKAAGDTLRAAYVQEMKTLNDNKDLDGANVLSDELEQRLLPEKLVSFQMAVAPAKFVNHYALLLRGNKPVGEGERMNATFELRAGLSNPSFVSIHSVNWPTAFVDHLGFRVRLTDAQEGVVWKEHSTWIQVPGLSDKKGVSFKPATHPDRYLRIRANGEAWVDVFQDDIGYRQETTFYIKPGLSKLW